MNHQSTLNRLLVALTFGATALVSTAAQADRFESALIYSSSTNSQLTRAEVLADLKVYQESGLTDAERLADELGYDSVKLHAARKRYAQLRNGERYAALVAQFALQRGESGRPGRGA